MVVKMAGNAKETISLLQFILLIHSAQFGLGVLTLPRQLAEKSGTDGWIAIILYWFLATAVSFIMIQIMKNYPQGTIIDLISHYFGQWLGKAAAAVFAFYFAVFAGSAFIREVLFVKLWVLRGSAVPVILLLLAVPSYLVVRKNISILGRYVQIVFFMTMWTMFVYFLTFKEAQFLHLLPVLKEGWKPIFEAVKTLILPFAGFEIILFLYPYLKNKDKAAVGAVIANTLTTVMYLAVSIGAFAFFSPDEITIYHEPEMMMLKVLEFTFVERLEIALFSFYLFTMSSTVLPVIFFTAFCFSKFAGQKKHDNFVILFLVFVLLFVFVYPPTYENIKYMQEFFVKCTLIVSFAFPLLLGGYMWLYNRWKTKGAAQ